MLLALNLNALMKRRVLGGSWTQKGLKAIRYGFIKLPGRLVRHARQLTLRLSAGDPSLQLLIDARRAIADLAVGPSG